MTLHKIDREKLAEAVRITKLPHSEHISFEILDYSAKHGEQFFRIVEKAAENWLAITDPGFEPSEKMKEAGESYAYGEYVENAVDGFKAMIATMIKGE